MYSDLPNLQDNPNFNGFGKFASIATVDQAHSCQSGSDAFEFG